MSKLSIRGQDRTRIGGRTSWTLWKQSTFSCAAVLLWEAEAVGVVGTLALRCVCVLFWTAADLHPVRAEMTISQASMYILWECLLDVLQAINLIALCASLAALLNWTSDEPALSSMKCVAGHV
eukprot:2439720-Amphidinium_carterae.1